MCTAPMPPAHAGSVGVGLPQVLEQHRGDGEPSRRSSTGEGKELSPGCGAAGTACGSGSGTDPCGAHSRTSTAFAPRAPQPRCQMGSVDVSAKEGMRSGRGCAGAELFWIRPKGVRHRPWHTERCACRVQTHLPGGAFLLEAGTITAVCPSAGCATLTYSVEGWNSTIRSFLRPPAAGLEQC